jgi:PAS domain S-box-containing protein
MPRPAESVFPGRTASQPAGPEEERRFLAALVQSTDDALLGLGPDGEITYWNPAALRMYGIAPSPAPALDIFALVPEDRGPETEAILTATAAGRSLQRVETVHHTRSGSRFDVSITASPLPAIPGQPPGAVWVVRDISSRKRVESELRASHRELASLHAISELVSAASSPQETFERIAREVSAVTGFPIVAIELLDAARGVMVFAATVGLPAPEGMAQLEVPVGETLSGVVASTGRRLAATDALERPEYANPFLRRLGVHTYVGAPMRAGERILGTLSLAHREVVPCDEWLQMWTENLANHIARLIERKSAETQLRDAEQSYRTLVEQLPVITYRQQLDESPAVQFISPQVESKLGFSPEEWTADPRLWIRQIHEDDLARVLEAVERCRTERQPLALDYRIRSRSGEVLWFHDEAAVVQDDSGRAVLTGARLEITERETQRGYRQRLQVLSRRLAEVQEAERRRVARELHDEIGQHLTVLKLTLQALRDRPAGADSDRLSGALATVDDLMHRVRSLSLDLRPTMLDDLGLLPALLWLIERFGQQPGVQVDFEHWGLGGRLDGEVETTVYRIVQEALTNVARHGRTDHAQVRVWADGCSVGLQVQDSGCGFELESVLEDRDKCGLTGIRERVLLLGGELTIDSQPGRGTCLTAWLHRPGRDGDRPSPGGPSS